MRTRDTDRDPDLPPVVTTVEPSLGFAALDRASRLVNSSLTLSTAAEKLDDIIAREELCARGFDRYKPHPDDYSHVDIRMLTGPVQAILLDPLLPRLTGDDRTVRVQQILSETKPEPFLRVVAPVLIPLLGIAGLGVLLAYGVISLLIGAAAGVALCGYMLFPRRHRAYVDLVNNSIVPTQLVIPARYPTIPLSPALQLATLTPGLWQPAPSQYKPTATATVTPASAKTPITAPDVVGRSRRIDEVHAAITELDAEWLDYQLNTEAWFLTRPQLRNLNDPVIKAYRGAEATLRDLADDLTDNSTETQIAAAQTAARLALKAWGTANAHALAIGVSSLSPSEEAALHTLHGLVGQLNDRATPKAMWPQLISAITRAMDKLTTVPFALSDVAELPVIKAESRLRAITQRAAPSQP